jgi:hypothetical protein
MSEKGMPKALVFIFGLGAGGVLMFVGTYIGVIRPAPSVTDRALAARIESIQIETICNAIASGKEISGNDHVTVWTDGKRYRVVGWRVNEGGTPVFYWTGADISGCRN